MPFWDDLSPAVKRYAIVAVVLMAALLGFRACSSESPTTSGKPSTRGVAGP